MAVEVLYEIRRVGFHTHVRSMVHGHIVPRTKAEIDAVRTLLHKLTLLVRNLLRYGTRELSPDGGLAGRIVAVLFLNFPKRRIQGMLIGFG